MIKNSNLSFEYMDDFVDYIVDKLYSDDDNLIVILAKFSEIREFIKGLIATCDTEFTNIDIECPEIDGYDDEFVLDCWYDDGVVNFGCEPAKRKGRYFSLAHPDNAVYILDNCSPNVIARCGNADMHIVRVGDGEQDLKDSCECRTKDIDVQYAKSYDGKVHGFSATTCTADGYYNFSYYTAKPLNEDDIESIVNKINTGVSQP